jgi:hypothetical protein
MQWSAEGFQDQGGGTAWATLERMPGEDPRPARRGSGLSAFARLKKFSESLETRRGFSNSLFVLK